jgi:hypothetical protein
MVAATIGAGSDLGQQRRDGVAFCGDLLKPVDGLADAGEVL